VNAGTLALVAAGTALQSTGFLVNTGATLTLDNNGNATSTAVILTNRIATSVNVTLSAGTLNFIANASTGVTPLSITQQLGTVVLGPGQSTIQTGFASAPAVGTTSVLTIAGLTRAAGGTVNFLGNAGGGASAALESIFNRLALTTVPTLTGNNGGILPYATVSGADFATYDSANNSIAAFTGYVTSIGATGTVDIVKLGAAEVLAANKTIAALLLTGNATVGEAGFTLTLSSGGLAVSSGSNITPALKNRTQA
jgi:hypothetical protein